MTEEMINDLADAFAKCMTFINGFGDKSPVGYWRAATNDDIAGIAHVIHKHAPDYDMQLFLERAMYSGVRIVFTQETKNG